VKLNLEKYRTFRGLNLWTELSARQFNKPAIRWIPIVGLLIVLFLAVQMGRAVRPVFTRNRLRAGDSH
jgi:hypothetical protein